MIQINLLPWREQERKEKKIRFTIVMGIFIGITIFFALLTHLFINSVVNSQLQNNNYLQTQINTEQAALVNLNKEKQKYNLVIKDLNFILSLREKSYKAVRLLDALARVVPEAVILVKITRDGDQITIAGKAQSNLQVTMLMKNIVQAKIFNQPVLSEISSEKATNSDVRSFMLTVKQLE